MREMTGCEIYKERSPDYEFDAYTAMAGLYSLMWMICGVYVTRLRLFGRLHSICRIARNHILVGKVCYSSLTGVVANLPCLYTVQYKSYIILIYTFVLSVPGTIRPALKITRTGPHTASTAPGNASTSPHTARRVSQIARPVSYYY